MHRRAQIASTRHSINRNKHVEGQFYIKCFVPGRKRLPAIHQPSIHTSYLTCRWMHAPATSYKFACRPSRQDFFSPDGRTRRAPAAFNAISRRRLILHRNLKTFLSHVAVLPGFGPNPGNRLRALQNVLDYLCKAGIAGAIALTGRCRAALPASFTSGCPATHLPEL